MIDKYNVETEFFVGNTNVQKGAVIPEYLKSFTTVRLGNIAYDIHGVKIPTDYMLPLFIGKSELNKYNSVMIARSK